VHAVAGGVNLDDEADEEPETSSQPVNHATSGEMMSEDDEMPSGLLGSWLII